MDLLPGLYIDTRYPFLAATPDSLVSCCCGEGIVEVKVDIESNQKLSFFYVNSIYLYFEENFEMLFG